MKNEIKVLIATVAFGMGFDKTDIAFVIHFQKPGNIVAYYQQIGRAGRGMEQAYAILFCGSEDNEINTYFIESAFPTEQTMNAVIDTVTKHPGIGMRDFEQYVDMRQGKIKYYWKFGVKRDVCCLITVMQAGESSCKSVNTKRDILRNS